MKHIPPHTTRPSPSAQPATALRALSDHSVYYSTTGARGKDRQSHLLPSGASTLDSGHGTLWRPFYYPASGDPNSQPWLSTPCSVP